MNAMDRRLGSGEPIYENALTVEEVVAQVRRMQEIKKAIMKEGVHYGKIPGTDKDTLFKPGADLLLVTFRVAANLEVEDLSGADSHRYRVTAVATHIITGAYLGQGVGECSSDEEKYKWRGVVCDDEFEEAMPDRRREKWVKGKWDKFKRGYGPASKIKQVRTSPADIANTVLKMAKKRASVDLTLTVTAASDMFSQDLEDLPPEIVDQVIDIVDVESEPPKPIRKEPTPADASIVCTDCKTTILPDVIAWSVSKHGRPLCRPCQDKAKAGK